MAMAGGIKLFQFLRKFYEMAGFYPSQSLSQNPSFNAKSIFFLFSLVQFLAASIAFFMFAVSSINERADCLYLGLTSAACTIHVLMHIYKITQILQLIVNFEKFIEKSNLKIKFFGENVLLLLISLKLMNFRNTCITFSIRIPENE